MYRLPVHFASSLRGKSCFVSRVKHNVQESAGYPLFSLHQIVGKIIKKGETGGYYTNKFAGESTYTNVENAVMSVTGSTLHTTDTYYQIRAHKNKSFDIRNAHQGSQFLTHYQNHLQDGLDWDDSMQTATWMLEHSPVSSLNNFSYQNIILVQPELLGQSRNRNAKEFFITWCNWIENYTRWNVYIVNNSNKVFKLQDGKFQRIQSSLPKGTLLSY